LPGTQPKCLWSNCFHGSPRKSDFFHRGAVSGFAMAFESRSTLVVMRMTVALSRLGLFDPPLGRYSDYLSSCEQVFRDSDNAISTRKACGSVDCRRINTCQRNPTPRSVRDRSDAEIRSFPSTGVHAGDWRLNLTEVHWPGTVCTLRAPVEFFYTCALLRSCDLRERFDRSTRVALMVPSSRPYPTRLPTFSSDHFGKNREEGRA